MPEKNLDKYLNVLVEPAPHGRKGVDTEQIMAGVVLALLPIWGLSIYKYGLVSLLMGILCIGICLALEHWILGLKKQKPVSLFGDYSAIITGLLFALTLPPSLPFWMAAVGAGVSITLGKHIFGGLGHNPFNPAIVGRVFLQISFAAPMTHWVAPFQEDRFTHLLPSNLTFPFMKAFPDGLSGATPLGRLKFEGVDTSWISFLWDQNAGSLGEISPLLVLIAGIYLALKKYLDWRIPVSILSITLILAFILKGFNLGAHPLFVISSGGLMLGAVFMASDMVTSPVTPLGIWLYGGLIAFLIVLIRQWGGLPEGVAFAILLANAVIPLIHLFTQPRVYGTKRKP